MSSFEYNTKINNHLMCKYSIVRDCIKFFKLIIKLPLGRKKMALYFSKYIESVCVGGGGGVGGVRRLILGWKRGISADILSKWDSKTFLALYTR